jgi:MoxR-like ATPase
MTQTASPPVQGIQQDIDTVNAIKSELDGTLIERRAEIDMLTLSLIARVHGLLIGGAGIAKSMLTREWAERIDFPARERYWEVLFRKTLPIEQVVGPVSLTGLTKDEFRYVTKDKLPEANIAFLDEVFKANAVVLNSLLTILNERKFHNNGNGAMDVPLWCAVGASNELPTEPELMAFRDRFGWCKIVKDVKTDDGFMAILRGQVARNAGTAVAASRTTISPEAIVRLQDAARQVTVPKEVLADLTQLRRKAEGEANLHVSPRRYGEGIKLAQAAALLMGRDHVTSDDLSLLRHVLWTDEEDIAAADKLVLNAFASKVAKASAELRAALEPLVQSVAEARTEVQAGGDVLSPENVKKLSDLGSNLRKVLKRCEAAITDAQSSNRDHAELDSIQRDINGSLDVLRKEILGGAI